MLLLSIALDAQLSVTTRMERLLEIFGNTMLHTKTQEYLVSRASLLLRFFEHGDTMLADYIDTSHLKHRERDDVEAVVRYWRDAPAFNMEALREQRMRSYFGDRYDSRLNVADWDYHMRLQKDCSVLHARHYKRWRECGRAFEYRECTYTEPNRTLASFREGRCVV